ncbi:oxidoreductase [Thermosipho melanesiensis]|uniref:Oxidoreductase FAD-binding domain protein n=2 Tax=Thermosipho melanesiensis TaxID=46541 RepID=A6LKR1_THEM4|nr:2Fe-2S iron-sulfur cluster binding domain-containing protein [Thermosipho melanesiensis]ABR30512.1 Oxidoreductase FAD-binding domain protein [Thermosipho melanesiensis BI429]APT73663.1 oxidoreductase [Thermosipho melanesiensis]OOC35604.1 oxidoreductase [Thermosipho melanesiensis]OOC39278.1 oxidoreductase [Thermosipho melanesiensis]OOC39364.1 oxidoreductase [Thermosipho melanesiensis]
MDVFFAPLIVGLISAVLSSFIVIVDAIVNNYGEVEIDINNGKRKLKVQGGKPLLFTLAEENIFIPSACGGRGSCGACKVKVLSDVGDYLPTELPYMSKEELSENIRLSCQIKVKKDIKIELPEELFNVKKFKVKVISLNNVTHDIKEVRLKLSEEINFKAGQYVQVVIPPYEKIKQPTQRAYSIASTPSKKDEIELLIRLVPGGIATTYVHNYLKVGDELEVIGPFGEFYMRDTQKDMICVAGGSGMAPIKSIIFDMYERGILDRNVWYFFGARTEKDLFYVDMFKELEKKWDKFHFIPALSEPHGDWKGEVGVITDVMVKYIETVIDKENEKEGYLCGSPGMINACETLMRKHGINEVYYDKFA